MTLERAFAIAAVLGAAVLVVQPLAILALLVCMNIGVPVLVTQKRQTFIAVGYAAVMGMVSVLQWKGDALAVARREIHGDQELERL